MDNRRGVAKRRTITVRDSVARYAEAIEKKLQARDEIYPWWGDIPIDKLEERTLSEVTELSEAVSLPQNKADIAGESVDVGAMAMMIHDNMTRDKGGDTLLNVFGYDR